MPLAIAHRGASARAPENSLEAFRLARELGADAVELDVHATADGALVVLHDEMLGHHHVAHCSLAEARAHRLANGEPVPTLDEALAVILPAMTAFVEIKSMAPQWDERLLACFDARGADGRVAVHSFDHRIIHRLAERRPSLSLGVLSASYPVRPLVVMGDADAADLWQHWGLLDLALVGTVHSQGGRVFAWTVDELADMRRLLAMGVDGICTNHPDRARQAIDSLPS